MCVKTEMAIMIYSTIAGATTMFWYLKQRIYFAVRKNKDIVLELCLNSDKYN